MTVSTHKNPTGVTGAANSGSVDVTDTDAVQSTVLTITLANGTVLTATEGTVETSTDVSAMTYVASTGSSGSKRTAAAASLAGALNANSRLTATSASSVVTITEVYGGTGGSLSHAGGGMSVVDFSGGTASHEVINRHTIAAGGTAGGYNITANIKNNLDLAKGRSESGSKVVATTGSAARPGIQAAFVAGGTLAYNPNARVVTRSSTDTGFLIRGGTFTKLSGKASTEHFLSRPGSDNTSRRGGNIHHRQDHKQAGTWATQIFDMFGGGLLQSDGTAKTGITGRGSDSNFIDPLVALGATQSQDSAATRKNLAGEFVILTNFTDYTSGDTSEGGAGSSNLMNYSSITG